MPVYSWDPLRIYGVSLPSVECLHAVVVGTIGFPCASGTHLDPEMGCVEDEPSTWVWKLKSMLFCLAYLRLDEQTQEAPTDLHPVWSLLLP